MKILELRFENLNSLYGEWIIDFTSPEYVSNGLFALTGPTGAGKSTILDAICLALYGATPRLNKIQGTESNEVMSRQTGECYAEVLFESDAGQFRCHWEQRKARKKADGKLQGSEHQISDAITGKPIETKKSLVGSIIEEKTGMDFDRFTRSMLLAQGGFDTFLKADVEQKSKILEQITGTKIYSEISRRVFERKKNERQKLELLKAETSGIIILEPEVEKEIHEDLALKLNKEKELEKQLSKTDNLIKWLNSISELKKEINNLNEESAKLQIKSKAFMPKQAKLKQAQKAAALDGTYSTLSTLRKQQLNDMTKLEQEKSVLPGLVTSANKQTETLNKNEVLTLKAKEKLKSEAPLIQKIRLLDQKIAEQSKSISELKESLSKDVAKINLDKQILQKLEQDKNKIIKQLEAVNRYLKENVQDEWLIYGITGLEEQFNTLVDTQKTIVQKEGKLKKTNTSTKKIISDLENSKKEFTACRHELEKIQKKLIQAQNDLSKLLESKLIREYRAEKESLQTEKGYIEKIAALEDHRAKLEDGKPCPLCGSTEHPFAKGNIPEATKIDKKILHLNDLISKAEDYETLIKAFEKSKSSATKKLNESEKREVEISNNKKLAEQIIEDLNDDLKKLYANSEKIKMILLKKLQPIGINIIPDSKVSLLIESLNSRLDSWQKHITQKNITEKRIWSIDAEKKRLDAVIDTQTSMLNEKQRKLELLNNECKTKVDERKSLYSDKSPDVEESRLNIAIANAEKSEKHARNINIDLQQKLATAKAHIESLKLSIKQREPELQNTEENFLKGLIQTGFKDEKNFLESKLTNEEVDSLLFHAKELDNAKTALAARQKDRETLLLVEETKKLSDKSLEDLEIELKEYYKALEDLRDITSTLKHKIADNLAAKERIKEKQSKIDAQKKEFSRWDKLNYYIGSADGKKYRNFAQGLTFELMISHANRQLHKMTDRYLLLRDTKEPLELNVIDDYQAGEVRSTKNLSGGESFIVSLSLALGLSKMASKKVRVDSLFLDEGFGTLDENALEIALEALSGLQQNGKVIGMISHVSALKERISTQIAVTPLSNGRSSLTGPGCKKL